MNWFKPTGNTIISFSGGRTSGMMLKQFIDAFGGTLPEHVKVIFCNTGKEMQQTLDFVRDCSLNWSVPIIWLEYQSHEEPQKRWKEVSYATASRNGEPFEQLIKDKTYLPNPTMRFCTIELKIRVNKLYTQQVLGWKNWDVAVGFRSDEPTRIAKLSLPSKEPFDCFAPLASRNITAKHVGEFWKTQPFDLNLSNFNGKTMHGNCDLCFLKGASQTLSLIAESPELADWWINQEKEMAKNVVLKGGHESAATFRKDRPSYAQLKLIATSQSDFIGYTDDAISCVGCTD